VIRGTICAATTIALVSACGASAPAPATPKRPAIDERTAESDAKGLVSEVYQTIGHADTDGLMTLLSDHLVVFGPRRTDSLSSRSDALVVLKALVDPRAKAHVQLHSDALDVVPSVGGHSAWAVDVVDIGGKPHAITAVLSNADDIWLVTAAAVAQTPVQKAVNVALAKDAVVPNGASAIAHTDPVAAPAVEKFRRGFADPKAWGDDLGKRTDAVVIGPIAGDITRGKSEIKKLWKQRAKRNTRAAAAGELTSGATPDGELAWVSAPIVQFADGDPALPMRAFAIYERNGTDWTMIALQQSLTLDEAGQGAAFKKIAAPAIEAKPDDADKPKPKPSKKKTKKAKKKHTDDDTTDA